MVWQDAGKGDVNNYIVKEEVVAGVYIKAVAASLFGKFNGERDIDQTEIIGGGGTMTIGSGKTSPVHVKTLSQNNTALFTLEEQLVGMPVYGDAAVKPGGAPTYMHTSIQARSIWTPAFQIPGYESRDNMSRVLPVESHIQRRKDQIALWMGVEQDLDAMRALFYGLSRGLFLDVDGGKGVKLYGTEGITDPKQQWRAPWNTYVAGASGLTAQSPNAATHNNNLAQALLTIPTGDTGKFTYETHFIIRALVDKLRMRKVTINGTTVDAIVLTDPRNMYSLRQNAALLNLWRTATPRSEKNLAIYSREHIILDDIMYMPAEQLSWFRPQVTGTGTSAQVKFGCGFDVDPRGADFNPNAGTQNFTASVVLGAGALRRGRRKFGLKFKVHEEPYGKGMGVCAYWDDGWMRNEWYRKDERAADMFCDSSLFVFNRDSGLYGVQI